MTANGIKPTSVADIGVANGSIGVPRFCSSAVFKFNTDIVGSIKLSAFAHKQVNEAPPA